MSKIEDFKVRERVAHVLCGDGIVTAIDEAGVHVRFDRMRRAYGGKRVHAEGVFDARWFALNPEYMFHRSTQREELGAKKGK